MANRGGGLRERAPGLWGRDGVVPGGDQVVTALCGDDVEAQLGDDIRDAEGAEYAKLIGEVRTMEDSRELIISLKDRGRDRLDETPLR
jgi:hypothetical protein